MSIVSVTLTRLTYWKIHKNDPLYTELKSIKGWLVVNPLCYSKLQHSEKPWIRVRQIAMINDTTVLAETNGILFIAPLLPFTDDSWKGPIDEFTDSFFKHLRHATKQAEIATSSISVSEGGDLLSVSPVSFPISTQQQDITIGSAYGVDTAITWQSIETTDATLSTNTLSIFGMLLLDAILALIEHDYRRSILYAAIAAETMASTVLEEAYEVLLKNGDPIDTIRLVALPPKGGVKDPIYEYLSSKSDFVQLIHQLPLYLLRRSLLVEDERLYQNARKLYATRNKIVHRGELSNDENSSYLPISEIGAVEAIECATGLFRWFGILEEYIIPKRASYKCFTIAKTL